MTYFLVSPPAQAVWSLEICSDGTVPAWEGRLHKAMKTGRHGSLAGVFGNQLLH